MRTNKFFSFSADIRKISSNDKIHKNEDDSIFYLHDINTKYYNTQIALLPINSTSDLTENVKSAVEGVLIYFDSNDVSTIAKVMPLLKRKAKVDRISQ